MVLSLPRSVAAGQPRMLSASASSPGRWNIISPISTGLLGGSSEKCESYWANYTAWSTCPTWWQSTRRTWKGWNLLEWQRENGRTIDHLWEIWLSPLRNQGNILIDQLIVLADFRNAFNPFLPCLLPPSLHSFLPRFFFSLTINESLEQLF